MMIIIRCPGGEKSIFSVNKNILHSTIIQSCINTNKKYSEPQVLWTLVHMGQ